MSSRLALGTVQFGLTYGIANRAGQVPAAQVADILAAARQAGIDTLDTAISYGQSEAVLGDVGVAGWTIVTKLPGRPADASRSWVADEIRKSLERLKVDRVHAVMLHRPSDLLGPAGDGIYRSLQDLRESGTLTKIGYSIYAPAELDALFASYPADIVQCPLNVFDQRLVSSGWLGRLVKQNVEVHTRSAFLQGLMLLDTAERPAKFARWARQFAAWDHWCSDIGGDRLAAALSAVLHQQDIARVVVGVDTIAQLRQIVLTSTLSIAKPPTSLSIEDEDLLNPSRWNDL